MGALYCVALLYSTCDFRFVVCESIPLSGKGKSMGITWDVFKGQGYTGQELFCSYYIAWIYPRGKLIAKKLGNYWMINRQGNKFSA